MAGDYEDSLSTKFQWTEEKKLELEEKRRFTKHVGICMARTDDPETRPEFLIGYPEIENPYELEDKCNVVSDPTTSSSASDPTTSSSVSDPTTSSSDPSTSPSGAGVTIFSQTLFMVSVVFYICIQY